VRYAADVGHDDTVMTIVNATTVFQKNEFKEMVEEYSNKQLDKEMLSYIKECMNRLDYVEGVDYGQVLRIRRQNQNQRNMNKNSGINWFGKN
jgi:hypothetical protein